MTIAVVAVQGAFIEQEQRLQELGVDCIELRKKEDLEQPYDGIVLPGGESTVQGKLLKELDMFDTIHKQIQEGMPVFATCAGLILLAGELENDTRSYFKTLPVTVRRNAYGRQLGSFHTEQEVKGIGVVPMTFIRAPYISKVDSKVEVLATVEEHIVAVKYKNQLAMSFHPELDEDVRILQKFVEMVKEYNSQSFEPLDEKIG